MGLPIPQTVLPADSLGLGFRSARMKKIIDNIRPASLASYTYAQMWRLREVAENRNLG